jgi:hypothetical protein
VDRARQDRTGGDTTRHDRSQQDRRGGERRGEFRRGEHRRGEERRVRERSREDGRGRRHARGGKDAARHEKAQNITTQNNATQFTALH